MVDSYKPSLLEEKKEKEVISLLSPPVLDVGADSCSEKSKFLSIRKEEEEDCVPPIIISGHQFSVRSEYQAAAEEYLHAYKILPNGPFLNLYVGTALINLAFEVRLKNKYQCVIQGMAFLFKYLKLCGESQEALGLAPQVLRDYSTFTSRLFHLVPATS